MEGRQHHHLLVAFRGRCRSAWIHGAALAWLAVVLIGIAKFPFKLLAPFVVPFMGDAARVSHRIFGVHGATDLSWWNIAIRNGVHNFTVRPAVEYRTRGNTPDETLEQLPGIQWRYRQSLDGKYVSLRVTWGKPRRKGKREFYIGWTMNETPHMRLTFFQFRPF